MQKFERSRLGVGSSNSNPHVELCACCSYDVTHTWAARSNLWSLNNAIAHNLLKKERIPHIIIFIEDFNTQVRSMKCLLHRSLQKIGQVVHAFHKVITHHPFQHSTEKKKHGTPRSLFARDLHLKLDVRKRHVVQAYEQTRRGCASRVAGESWWPAGVVHVN